LKGKESDMAFKRPLPEALRLMEVLHGEKITFWMEISATEWHVESEEKTWEVEQKGSDIEVRNVCGT